MSQIRATFFSLMLTFGLCVVSHAEDAVPVLDGITVDFELLNGDGELVRYEEFRGKNVLLAFGFTHCAHICPMIAANMAGSLKASDKDAVGIFISVDTERDTPAITNKYASGFSERMLGLGGSYQEVSAAAQNFNVTFVVTKSEDNYTVQHTPSIFLIGPDGDVIDVFAMNASPSLIAAAMK
jgi:protein SCO1/2